VDVELAPALAVNQGRQLTGGACWARTLGPMAAQLPKTSTRRPGIEGSGSRPSPPAAASARNHALGVRPAARPRDNFVGVTFAMMVTEFAEASQVIKIINGEIEPP
jgi:hypothetical protein